MKTWKQETKMKMKRTITCDCFAKHQNEIMKPGVSIRTKMLRKDNARVARKHSEMIKTDIEHDAVMLLVK
jgi:hypothetical protein